MAKYLAFGAAAALMTVAIVWFFVTDRHEAFALLQLSSKQPNVLLKTGDSAEGDFAVFKRTQAQLIRSGMVTRRAVADPAIRELPMIKAHSDDAAEWLSERLQVTYPDDSEIMRVALTGSNPDVLVKVVDMVVKKYLTEVVQHERDLRLEQENKLEKRYSEYFLDFTKQTNNLHTMEAVATADGSDSARTRQKLATADLDEAIATRSDLRRRLSDNAMQIMLARARGETPPETRTSSPIEAGPGASSRDLTLEQLELQKDYLEKRLEESAKEIEVRARQLEHAHSFSSEVAAKQEELAALKTITARLRAELDNARVERMARDRVSLVDNAVVASRDGDLPRKFAVLAGAAIASLGLVAVGIVVGRSPRS